MITFYQTDELNEANCIDKKIFKVDFFIMDLYETVTS